MIYKNVIKRVIDFILSLIGIVVLAIPMLMIAVAIKLDSPGPVLFKQKRVGIHKTHFQILKFRTMLTDTPHDAPLISYRALLLISQKLVHSFEKQV